MNLWIATDGLDRAERLFGVPPLERLCRGIGPLRPGDTVTLSGPAAQADPWRGARIDADTAPLGTRLRRAIEASPDGALVALRGADATDPRLIRFLGGTRACVASRGEGAHRVSALSLDRGSASAIPPDAASLNAVADALLAAGRIAPLEETAFPAYIDKLRRTLPWWQYAVDGPATRRAIERRLFLDNYKGSTDLLTRWVYPPLVWPLVRLATRWGIHPNVLTAASVILAFAAVPLWASAHWLAGFACAYAMSILDSVDGKVARLTLTDSRIGNVLDHGLDQVHPPFWYIAWAWGLGGRSLDDPLYVAALALVAFYVADRLVLGVARWRLGFALHAATRLDGAARSIIARRNVTMTIMAMAMLIGAGAAGLWIVTAWQGLTFAWHATRTLRLGFLARERPRPHTP